MKYILLITLFFVCEISFSQTTVSRDTIRVPGKDSITVIVSTKTTTILTGSVIYTYPQYTTVVTYYKVPNSSPTPPNQSPQCNAGGNQSITLPVNSVNLSGTASDPDGQIVNVLWSKVVGGNAVIVSPNSLSTSVNNLVAGTYQFNLTVTDNAGATASSNATVTVNPAVIPPPTGYILNYSNNYDVASDINSNQLGRGSISNTVFLIGGGSFRSEVRAGDPPISSGWRSEQQYDGAAQNPIEGAVEYDVYYENWKDVSNDGGGHSIQWHPNTNGGSAIISLQNYSNKFDVVRSLFGTNYHQQGTLRPVISNHWYHMRWEFKWSTGTDGYVRLFMDGETTPYFSFNGKTADGSGQYLKQGQNRWSWSGGNMTTTTVCYYDNLRIYKKQ